MATAAKQNPLIQKMVDKFEFGSHAELMETLKKTAFRQKEDVEITNSQMMALLVVADQYGLNPFTRELFAYPDKSGIVPVVSVDGWLRIINQHEFMDGLEFQESEDWISIDTDAKPCPKWMDCVIYRKDRKQPTRVREYLDEIYRPIRTGKKKRDDGTWYEYTITSPHQTHTKRMLRHKALIQCARVAFGFAGIYDEDEAKRILEAEPVNQDVIDGVILEGKPSEAAEKLLLKLVDRATKEKSWAAAIDYVTEKCFGYDAQYLKTELEKAQKLAEAIVLPPQAALESKTNSMH